MITNSLDNIEEQICSMLANIGEQGTREHWVSDRIWTAEIKRQMGNLGKNNGFYICASGWSAPHGQGEWLYDVVWLQNKDVHIIRVPLVLECEWGIDLKNIDEDFCKLLVARADHRVMIFQQKTQEDVIHVFNYLESQIGAFQQSSTGDRYLLWGFDWTSTHGFTHRLILV